MKRRTLLKVLGAGTLGGVAACVPEPSATKPGETGETGETKELSFTSWAMNEATSKPVVRRIVAGYAARRKLTIRTPSYPYNNYLSQLTLQARGGRVSGAVQLDIAWLGAVAALGRLADLGEYASGYTEAGLASGRLGGETGEQYGLPWTTGSIGLLANTNLLTRAGIAEHPKTIDDFETALLAIRKAVPGVVPYAASTKVAQLKDILVWMRTFGCPLIEDGRVAIGDAASVEAVAWYTSLYERKLIAPDVDRFDARALFAQQKAAIYDDAIVGKGVVAAQSPDKELASKLAPLTRPVLTAGQTPRAALWGHLVVVFDDAAAEPAAAFARFLTSDRATAVGYFEQTALPPTTQAALDDPAVAGDEFTRTWNERITATAEPSPFWVYPQYARMETAVAEQVQAVLVGRATPAEAMRQAGRDVQELIA